MIHKFSLIFIFHLITGTKQKYYSICNVQKLMLDPLYTVLSNCWPSFKELINYWLILALEDLEKITNEVSKRNMKSRQIKGRALWELLYADCWNNEIEIIVCEFQTISLSRFLYLNEFNWIYNLHIKVNCFSLTLFDCCVIV